MAHWKFHSWLLDHLDILRHLFSFLILIFFFLLDKIQVKCKYSSVEYTGIKWPIIAKDFCAYTTQDTKIRFIIFFTWVYLPGILKSKRQTSYFTSKFACKLIEIFNILETGCFSLFFFLGLKRVYAMKLRNKILFSLGQTYLVNTNLSFRNVTKKIFPQTDSLQVFAHIFTVKLL